MVARPCPWFVENSGYRPNDIAIVGMAGRFPGADSVEALWSLLVNGAEGIRDLQAVAESAPDAATKASSRQRVKRSALLNDAYGFDAACFGLSASEALVMDPQQRLLLQCAWHALEAAACDPQRFSGDIACYVGIGSSQYLLDRILQRPDIVASIGEKTVQLGNDPAFAATQLAYRLGLRGAALTLNSACSTSLVGVQLACAALQRHECQLALVGGSQISRHHGQAYPVQSGGILSAQGRCRPFDASADGTISGSGCAVVALQTLKQAWTDRRRIIAVIKSVAVNNDGADKLGFTAPSVAGQAQVIRRAIKAANINAEDIAYHECHGTATPLGDPVEIAALAQAHNRLSPKRPAARPCYLGALKANVGHLAAAAGVSGLLKTALVLERAQIPPLAHFQQLNAALKPWPEFLNIPQQSQAWPQAQHDSEATPSPRYASVSAFGMGGTNAHAVLQEAPTQQQHQSQRQCYLLPVSARTPEALERLCDDLSEHIQTLDRTALAAVAHTLIHGRRRLACRCVLVVSAHAQSKQASGTPPRPFRIVRSAIGQHSENRETVKLALILPGQGSQSVGMGRSYYREEAAYREAVERCLSIVNRLDEPALDFDPKALLLGAPSAKAEQRLWRTDAAQLLLFIHGYAMAQMWQHWGVHEWGSHGPALVGHSLGEYVAMVVAGELPLQQGLQLILRRGRAMAQAPVGAMLAVLARATQVQAELQRFSTEQASLNTPAIALLNSPQHIMVAGDVAAIDAFQIQLQQQGIASKRLGSRHAFHTQAMAQAAQQVAADWEALVVSSAHCSAAECDLRVVANLTGTWMRKDEARDPEYWRRHTQEPV
ncbi:MAG: type I polyketide synthase, partial [Xanthomonadales bacterium]|nr:type I polyketide synthase [Xanthomonadales bacterium]